MYQKYYTETIVLGSRERGESDRVFALYTKDFGLVHARASAVRKESSRMRYALQSYSRAHVALVKGKRGWRAGGSTAGTSQIASENLPTFARIALLVLRLVAGEGQNPYVFAALSEAHDALSKGPLEARATIELVCVARILFGLGYLSHEAFSTTLFAHTSYAHEHIQEAEALREKLLATVNRAINETHL